MSKSKITRYKLPAYNQPRPSPDGEWVRVDDLLDLYATYESQLWNTVADWYDQRSGEVDDG